jgi:hypothetical protein
MINTLQQIGKSVQTTQNWAGKSALALLFIVMGLIYMFGMVLLAFLAVFSFFTAKDSSDRDTFDDEDDEIDEVAPVQIRRR